MKWSLAIAAALSLTVPALCVEDHIGTVVGVQDGDTFDLRPIPELFAFASAASTVPSAVDPAIVWLWPHWST